jgi:hypothetical protein
VHIHVTLEHRKKKIIRYCVLDDGLTYSMGQSPS